MSSHKDRVAHFADDLQIVHNCLRRGLVKCIAGWKDPLSVDVPSFAIFSKAIVTTIHAHHDHEETAVFPMFDHKNIPGWDAVRPQLLAEHKELMEHLHNARDLCVSAMEGVVQAGELVSAFEGIQSHLLPHLEKEELFVDVDKFLAAGVTSQDIDDVDAKIVAANRTMEDGHIVFPAMVWNMPDDEYDRFARVNLPWIMRKLVLTWIMYYKGASSIARYCDYVRSTWNA